MCRSVSWWHRPSMTYSVGPSTRSAAARGGTAQSEWLVRRLAHAPQATQRTAFEPTMNDNADHISQEGITGMTEQQRASTTYLLDNALAQARERISAGAAWLDPWTTAQLEAIGVAPGWACLEAGAGGGSVTEWLCKRVGDQGRVLATDIDTRFVGELTYPNLDVRRHDITTDDVPESEFDLVHARLLLEHLPAHALALSKLVAALKPGGWLLVED